MLQALQRRSALEAARDESADAVLRPAKHTAHAF
jgi:hypothetical protein